MSFPKITSPLLLRGVIFLCLFVLISGAIGPRIISSDILFRDGFAMYGGIGKAMIFGVIAFALLVRHNTSKITLGPWRARLLWWFVASLAAFCVSWVNVSALLAGKHDVHNLLLAHAGLILCPLLAAIGCIGPKNIQRLWHSYKQEIINSIAIGVAFYMFLLAVYALWQPLASIVLQSVRGLLGLIGLHATVIPPYTLLFDKFGITVAQYCSGIESIALFTSLYAVVGLLDWPRIHKKRYFMLFPLALLLLCLLNVVRVAGLILAGYYINPHIAFSLFHTYAGMVFFILYSLVFWSVAYKYLFVASLAKKQAKKDTSTTN